MTKKILLSLCVLLSLATFVFVLEKTKSKNASVTSNKILVSASFYPLAEFASQIGKEFVDVKNLTPAGTEPHDFDPSPQDIVRIQNSTLLIYNGAGFELWIDKLKEDIRQHTLMVNVSENITLLSANPEKIENNRSLQNYDPHVWMDPVLADQQVETIKDALITVDPSHAVQFEQSAQEYHQRLMDLNTDFRTGLANCTTRNIVTAHNAFQYLGKRYGLNVVSISGLSPDEEPSPKKLAEVATFVKKNNIKYIFFETLVSPKLSETIAQETGAKTIAFNPLEGLTNEEIGRGKNYITVQRDNLAALKTALECK